MSALLLTCVAPASFAQQGSDSGGPWSATAELSFTDASGNQDLSVLTTGLDLERAGTGPYGLQLALQARYGSSENTRIFENYKGEANIDLAPSSDRWSPFIHSTGERDVVNRLNLRFNSGAGVRYRLYRADDQGDAALSLAMLYSYEALTNESAPMESSHRARWSLQLDGRQEIRDGVTVSHRTHFQPTHRELRDYLISTETTFKVLVTSRVALSISHELERDNEPPAGVDKDNRLLKAGILVEL